MIPSDGAADSTIAFLREGYTFTSSRCARLGSDIFKTRLMLRRVYCAMGEEAAEMFYYPGRFTRKGALPPTTLRLLQDKGSGLVLDAEAHRNRKEMFMSIMTPRNIQALLELAAGEWTRCAAGWHHAGEVVLLREVENILCHAVLQWAGLKMNDDEACRRCGEFAAMIDGAGSAGPRMIRGLVRRSRSEIWAQRVVEAIRRGSADSDTSAPAHIIATHRDMENELLPVKVAAVELINLLRPTVAVARFITFAALALHDYPEWRERLAEGSDEELTMFAQEVRRFYPFFPMVGGRALQEFEWRGTKFSRGSWVMIDLYGTNHDKRKWESPHEFWPERFRQWDGSPFGFIPQGGGDFDTGHRCAGERLTIELVKSSTYFLVKQLSYAVPGQDLSVDLSRMPAQPRSGFLISNVRLR